MNSGSYQLPHTSKYNQTSHYIRRQPQPYQQSSEDQYQPSPYKRFLTWINPRVRLAHNSTFFAHLAGSLSILAGLGAFVYLFFSFAVPDDHYMPSAPAATLNNYCDALKRHYYRVAYDQLLTPTQEFPDEADFASSLYNAEKVFGGLTGCIVYAVNENDFGVADGSFSLTYSNGAEEFFATRLAEVGGTWKITEIDKAT